ncbi:MAG: hypothetical protein AB2A00_40055 [Myxococcota bacterium]
MGLLRRLMAVGAVTSLLACATTSTGMHQGELPPPPTDEQLRNDGSPEQQDQLLRRYAVYLEDGAVRVGTVTRPDRSWPLSPALDPDVERHLATDPAARQVIASADNMPMLPTAAAFAGSLALLALGVPVVVVVGIILVGVSDVLASLFVILPPVRPFAATLNIATAISFTTILSTVGPLSLLPGQALAFGGVTLWMKALRNSRGTLGRAVAAYNRGLKERIRRAGPASETPAAP